MVKAQNPARDVLSRKTGGGVTKAVVLTAAEKRKRTIEAGKKFSKFQRFRQRVERSPTFRKLLRRSAIMETAGSVANDKGKHLQPGQQIRAKECALDNKAANTRLKKDNGKIKATSVTHSRLLNKGRGCASDTEAVDGPFQRDDDSLQQILSCVPIVRPNLRPSSAVQTRHRPSLFPNGINPLDEAAMRFSTAKQRTTVKEESFLSSTRKTPGKSVRFADAVCPLPSVTEPVVKKSGLQKLLFWLPLAGKEEQLEKDLLEIPVEDFTVLATAISKVCARRCSSDGDPNKNELLGENFEPQTFLQNLKTLTEARGKEERSGRERNTRSSRCLDFANSSFSQVYADQEVTLLTEKPVEENEEQNRPVDPIASSFATPKETCQPPLSSILRTPNNCFRPVRDGLRSRRC